MDLDANTPRISHKGTRIDPADPTPPCYQMSQLFVSMTFYVCGHVMKRGVVEAWKA